MIVHGGDGARYTYCHASAVYVGVGDQVKAAPHIMATGNTGRSTGPHLNSTSAGKASSSALNLC